MCAYSMMADYGRQRVPQEIWQPDTWRQFKDVLDAIKRLDDKLGQSDCPDPAKAKWMKEMERRMAALEKKAKQKEAK